MQISTALSYFQDQAATAEPKVQALYDALVAATGSGPATFTGNGTVTETQSSVADTGGASLNKVKAAYIASRPEYEQIEVLAPGFEDVDCWIDCRACATLGCM